MAKRKSFEEKNNYIHPSRKLIIDTVFGREDNTQKVHGYEGEVETDKEVGEIWTDKEGKTWEQKDGYKISVSQMDDVRKYLEKLNTCQTEDCNTIKYSNADKKLIRKTGKCATCLAKEEAKLRADGTYPFYEDYKITNNQLSYVIDLKAQFEEGLRGVSQTLEFINEDGTIQKWHYDIDIDKVKEDLQKDIDGATEAIEALLERKAALEDKLRELNHSELIKN
jgi:uncharacterized protein (DUF849 family)